MFLDDRVLDFRALDGHWEQNDVCREKKWLQRRLNADGQHLNVRVTYNSDRSLVSSHRSDWLRALVFRSLYDVRQDEVYVKTRQHGR